MHKAIIIGGGAAGLFCGALTKTCKGLIIEGSSQPGQKLLVSGSGQCNLTHSGSIKDFIPCYGDKGSKIRSALYKFNNLAVMDFFQKNNLPVFTREDGKVFPKTLSSKDVRNLLVEKCMENGWEIVTGNKVTHIFTEPSTESNLENKKTVYSIETSSGRYRCNALIVATGGCSYPKLGSDGSIFSVLDSLGLDSVQLKPVLVPVFVENYPFSLLAGISFSNVRITLRPAEQKNANQKSKPVINNGDLLFTHTNISGPGILDISRSIEPGMKLEIEFYKGQPFNCNGVKKSLKHFLAEETNLPERFIQLAIEFAGGKPNEKAASVPGNLIKRIYQLLVAWPFTVSGNAGFNKAMVTAGGISLDEINIKTFECKKHPGLFLAGEVLDVDGNTGGYNLQFAFSSAAAVAKSLADFFD